nr:hypothetical protein [Actinomycetales bacterium]
MLTLRFDQTVPHSREHVFRWHARPGVVRRLTPPFVAEVMDEPERGLATGARSHYRLRHLPWPMANWTTEYTEVEHGTGFTDSLVQGPLRSWRHHHSFEDLGSTTRVRDEIELCLPRRAPEFAERSVATTMAR